MRQIPSIYIFVLVSLIILMMPGLTCVPGSSSSIDPFPPINEDLYKPLFISRDSLGKFNQSRSEPSAFKGGQNLL